MNASRLLGVSQDLPTEEETAGRLGTQSGARTTYTKGPRFAKYTLQALKDSGRLTITVEETGRFLSIGRGAAFEAVRNGEIPSLSVGRRRLVPVPALLKILGVDGE